MTSNTTETKKGRSKDLPSPDQIVTYPIGSESDAGALFLFGDLSSPNVAILCAGFPDDHENFLPFASRLAKEADCLTGVTCLPGYDDRDDRPYTDNKVEGYTPDEMCSAMREAIKALRMASTFKGKGTGERAKLIGIFHDWGVMPGTMYCNRAIENTEKDNDGMCLDKMVLFDVMGRPHPDTKDVPVVPRDSVYKTVVTLWYRIILASAFGIRRYVSGALAQVYAALSFIPLQLLGLGPTYDIDAKVADDRVEPIGFDRLLYMAYPYFYMFVGPKSRFADATLPKDLEQMPVLYMYGTKKRVNFHDERSLLVLKREEERRDNGRSKSRVVAVEGAGHWLYIHEPDLCLEEVKKFVLDSA